MIDPLSALAIVKGGISAGRTIASMSKELAGFFDSVDGAKKAHEKKKQSPFSSTNEEALDTFMKRQQAKQAEEELREFIVNNIGYSAYQELLKLRREVAQERKEAERQARIDAERMKENAEMAFITVVIFLLICGGALGLLVAMGWVDL
jgi:flagellar biosynthesis protein FliP